MGDEQTHRRGRHGGRARWRQGHGDVPQVRARQAQGFTCRSVRWAGFREGREAGSYYSSKGRSQESRPNCQHDVHRGRETHTRRERRSGDGQTPKGPHLVDIGKRYKADELVESILKPSEKLAQGFESYRFDTADGRVFQGFIVSERADATIIRETNGVLRELKRGDIEKRQQQKQSAMPEGLAANLTAGQLADLIAYLQSLR